MQKIVYISSTYKDLVAYRSAIRDMFLSKGLNEEYDVVGMEGYVSENGKRAIDVCLEDVRAADIYILILAKRYGSIVDGTNISYTESEYDEAVLMRQKNPQYKLFIFYSKEEMENEDFGGAKNIDVLNLENFYDKVLKDNAGFTQPFSTPDNLCKQILLTFTYNFKTPESLGDFKEALMLIDRNVQSYSFSKCVRRNTNSFCFSSLYENSPRDFSERLYDLEMGGKYRKCLIELAQFQSTVYDKFKEEFIAQLSSQWIKDMETYSFEKEDKFFLCLEINSDQIKSQLKIDFMAKVLTEFLPSYLISNNSTTTANRIFFIYYSYKVNPGESTGVDQFDTFIQLLRDAIKVNGSLNNFDSLNDITKTDAKNWLDVFVKRQTFDEDDVDEILQAADEPYKTFKMKEMNRLIKKWMSTNLFNNR
jgi:Domain of unknown function (DUF4062)